MDTDTPYERTPRAPWLVMASCIVLLLAVAVLALEFLTMGRGRGDPFVLFTAVMSVLAAGIGTGLVTLSMILPKGSVAAKAAGAIGGLIVVVAGLVTAVNGIFVGALLFHMAV